MTEEKYYSLEKDGTYCLGFPNKHALSEKEIEEIFSDYGDVISVRTSGDERGFRFVRFKLEEEAGSAVQGLKGHKKIRILPKKLKTSNNSDRGKLKENQKNNHQKNLGAKKKVISDKNKRRDDDDDDVDDDWNDSFNDDLSVFHSTNQRKPYMYGGVYNGSFKTNSDVSKNDEDSTNVADTENLMKLLRIRSLRGVVSNNFGLDHSSNFYEEDKTKNKFNQSHDEEAKNISNSKHLSNHFKSKKFHNVVDSSVNLHHDGDRNLSKSFRQQNSQLNSGCNSSDNVLKLIKDPVILDLPNDNGPPELISTVELKQRSVKGSVCSDETVKVVLAEEVIVANIHEKFSVLYILYLFEKFEPISITEIKTISQNGVRYCSVYFKSQKDAIAVEKHFDNFELSENKLIVRTSQLLINEVGAV